VTSEPAAERLDSRITIRLAKDPVGAHEVERLQLAVWGMDPIDVVPHHQLVTAAKWGGGILIAYVGEKPVGFSYGFIGLDDDQPVLCSHMLGVLPEHQAQNVGFRLKLAQRELARERGLARIVWTFDPMESRNAYLNLHKLGAFTETYLIDHYGPMEDELNAGLPSDRLLADWRINEARTEQEGRTRIESAASSPIVNPPDAPGVLARPGDVRLDVLGRESMIRIAVAADSTAIKRSKGDLASAWRHNLRLSFEPAFAHGYRAVDMVAPKEGVAFYVLVAKEES
jgi:predicted GNAT superfamily acetyltransferase